MTTTALNQAYFLRLYERLFPPHWLVPLQSPGPGYEVLQAFAAVGARASTSVRRTDEELFILTSHAGSTAIGFIDLVRPTAAAGAVTVHAGSRLRTSRAGRVFLTLVDAVFGALDTEVLSVPIAAEVPSDQFNVRGQFTTADGTVIPGEIDVAEFLDEDPVYSDLSIVPRQILDTSGGVFGLLDEHGRDRGLPRHRGEPDAAYRQRIRMLPDTVSPAAIRRQVQAFLAPYGLTAADWRFDETFLHQWQECWDAPSANAGTPTFQAVLPSAPFNTNLFAYDDERDETDWPVTFIAGRYLDTLDARGAFYVIVPRLPTLLDLGMAYDDTAVTPLDHTISVGTITGRRAQAAFDVPATADLGLIVQGAYDGTDIDQNSLWSRLGQLLDEVRAAGVYAELLLRGT